MKSKLGNLKDGAQFCLSPRKKVLYRLDTFEGSTAVISSVGSGRTFHRPKRTVVFLVS
jgi:hypothetical protein